MFTTRLMVDDNVARIGDNGTNCLDECRHFFGRLMYIPFVANSVTLDVKCMSGGKKYTFRLWQKKDKLIDGSSDEAIGGIDRDGYLWFTLPRGYSEICVMASYKYRSE